MLGITVQAGPIPAAPTIATVGSVQIDGASTVYFTGHRPTFTGTTDPGSFINVEIHSDLITLTTTADGSGNWSVTPNQDIPTGEHTVSITATKDGSTSEVLGFTLIIDPNSVIPSTGANATALRYGGLVLLLAGLGVNFKRRRWPQKATLVPSLFP